jgi:hypothetical protein
MNAIISAIATNVYVALTAMLRYSRSIFPSFKANPLSRWPERTSIENATRQFGGCIPSGVGVIGR